MRTVLLICGVLCLCFYISGTIAAEKPGKHKKQTPFDLYLTAAEAYNLKKTLGNKAYLVDIRTPGEVMFVGMAHDVDIHIPFYLADYSRWDPKKRQYAMKPNPDFIRELQNHLEKENLDKDASIILMCRSGSRSAKAARLLYDHDYKRVYTVIDGFEGDAAKVGEQKGQRVVNGWKNAGLPWSYRTRKEQLSLGK